MFAYYRLYALEIKRMFALPALPSTDSLWTAGAISAASIIVAVLGGFEKILWIPAGVMLIGLLILMSFDLATKYYSMPPNERPIFMWEREITGKLLLLVLVVMSLVLDVIIYAAANFLPGEFKILDGGYLFTTFTTMLWLIAAHIFHITTNIAVHQGDDFIPPTLDLVARQIKWVIRSIKKIDLARGRESDGPGEIRPERWIDKIADLTDEEAEEVAKYFMGKLNKTPEIVKPLDTSHPSLEKLSLPPKE